VSTTYQKTVSENATMIEATEIIAETERLRLRTLSLHDAAFYLELVNDPSFINNIRDKGIRSIADAEAAIQTGHQEIQAKFGYSLYFFETKDVTNSIGLCGLVRRDQLPGIDLGYALLPNFWRQGYAEEACRAVINLAHKQLKEKQLYAIVSPHNLASSKLLEKLGFQFHETLDWTDGPVLFYSLTFTD